MAREQLTLYSGGWAFYASEEIDAEVRVRFVENQGRVRVSDVWVSSEDGIDANVLRQVPLARILSYANGPRFADEVHTKMRDDRLAVDRRTTQAKGELAPMAGSEPLRWTHSPKLRLRVPSGPGRKPDDFYRRVADAYSYLATRTRRPARELADANDVPDSTVHGWVKEARRRGYLLKGQRVGGQQ